MSKNDKVFRGRDWLNREPEAMKCSFKHSSKADCSEMYAVSLTIQGHSSLQVSGAEMDLIIFQSFLELFMYCQQSQQENSQKTQYSLSELSCVAQISRVYFESVRA